MIDLYTYATPNGRKPAIALEEMGLPYTVHKVNISKGEQFSPEFIALNPNSKIPVITDQDTQLSLFESGAILIYLAEKTGQFLPTSPKERFDVLQWLMFQMGSVGPMFGQLGHFRNAAPETLPYAINRYEQETLRLFAVLDRQLAEQDYVAGDYSIADMAIYPWVMAYPYLQVTLDAHPHLKRWTNVLGQRSAVQAGMAVLSNP
ncbi:MAG: glutathione S-transferase N-terminal domain-containing protein [Cyanobacteria bacterium P01_G01_bin.54]